MSEHVVVVSFMVSTDKEVSEVEKAVKKGIYRELDIKGVGSPKDVTVFNISTYTV